MKPDVTDTRSNLLLLNLARSGDRNAFGQLVSKHYQRCVNVATSVLRDRSEAEDKVQQAVWKAFEHLDQYLGEAEFFTWLARIVVNECRMLLRDRRRARFVYLSDVPDAGEHRNGGLLPPPVDPEHEVVKLEMIEVLKTEIRHIPPLLREVIVLRDVNELPMSKVAYELGITVAAAKSRLLRGRNELRGRVTARFGQARRFDGALGKHTPPPDASNGRVSRLRPVSICEFQALRVAEVPAEAGSRAVVATVEVGRRLLSQFS